MYRVYILKSLAFKDKSYVGLTKKPVKVRLHEHNEGDSQSTKAYRPWLIAYYEIFDCRRCATRREKYFKSGVGRKLKSLILESI